MSIQTEAIRRNAFNKGKLIEHLICLKILRGDLNIIEGEFTVLLLMSIQKAKKGEKITNSRENIFFLKKKES